MYTIFHLFWDGSDVLSLPRHGDNAPLLNTTIVKSEEGGTLLVPFLSTQHDTKGARGHTRCAANFFSFLLYSLTTQVLLVDIPNCEGPTPFPFVLDAFREGVTSLSSCFHRHRCNERRSFSLCLSHRRNERLRPLSACFRPHRHDEMGGTPSRSCFSPHRRDERGFPFSFVRVFIRTDATRWVYPFSSVFLSTQMR